MNELALFTGAGGGILGGNLLGWQTICAVEIDPYCRSILLARQNDGSLEPFPIWDDIRTFDGHQWRGVVDVVSAGFPCQPFSVAGQRKGENDERNMWPETIRVIREVGPRFCLLENVPGLLAHEYFGQILGELAESGYDCRWDCIPASSIGAPHRRDRLWIIADANGIRRGAWSSRNLVKHPIQSSQCSSKQGEISQMVAHAHGSGFGEQWRPEPIQQEQPSSQRIRWWETEPDVGRVAHGVASRVDRLKAIGNGQVPGVVRKAWECV